MADFGRKHGNILQGVIAKALKFETLDGTFVSKDNICAIMTEDKVLAALYDSESKTGGKIDAARTTDVLIHILRGAQRIFAILVTN